MTVRTPAFAWPVFKATRAVPFALALVATSAACKAPGAAADVAGGAAPSVADTASPGSEDAGEEAGRTDWTRPQRHLRGSRGPCDQPLPGRYSYCSPGSLDDGTSVRLQLTNGAGMPLEPLDPYDIVSCLPAEPIVGPHIIGVSMDIRTDGSVAGVEIQRAPSDPTDVVGRADVAECMQEFARHLDFEPARSGQETRHATIEILLAQPDFNRAHPPAPRDAAGNAVEDAGAADVLAGDAVATDATADDAEGLRRRVADGRFEIVVRGSTLDVFERGDPYHSFVFEYPIEAVHANPRFPLLAVAFMNYFGMQMEVVDLPERRAVRLPTAPDRDGRLHYRLWARPEQDPWSTDGTYFVLPDDDQYDPLLVGRSRTVMAFLDGTAEPVATVRVPDGLYNPEADGTPMLGLHHWISDHEFVFWHGCCGHSRCSHYDVSARRVVGSPSECPPR